MKKAMLFFVAFLFSVGVNAATLSIDGVGSTFDQDVSLPGSVVLGGGTVSEGPGTWFSAFDVDTDATTAVKVEWSFNPKTALTAAVLEFDNGVDPVQFFNITGDFSFTAIIYEGFTAWVDIKDATRNVLKYDVSVSAVPVPAALFLFAPALLGFLGLRRKSAVAA